MLASRRESRSKRDADRSVVVKEEEGNRGRSQLPERNAWREVVVGGRESELFDPVRGGRRVNAEGGGGSCLLRRRGGGRMKCPWTSQSSPYDDDSDAVNWRKIKSHLRSR